MKHRLQILYWELTYWPKAFTLLIKADFKHHHPNNTRMTYLPLVLKRQCRLSWLRGN